MLRYTKRLLIGVALLLAFRVPAQAGPMPSIFYSYYTNNTSPLSGIQYIPEANGLHTGGGIIMSNPGTAGTPYPLQDGTKQMILSNLTTVLLPTDSTKASFDPNPSLNPPYPGGRYDINLTLSFSGVTSNNMTPAATSTLLSHDFFGAITGSYQNLSTNLGNTFYTDGTYTTALSSPPSYLFDFSHPAAGQQAYNLEILVQLYDPSGSLPGAPRGGGSGTFEATATVFGDGSKIGGGTIGSVSQVPEPSAMLLSCLGLAFLGGAGWRKRRQTGLALVA